MTTVARAREAGVPCSSGRFLRLPDVIATTGLGRSTLYRMIAKGEFPRQIKVTAKSSGWWQEDVDRWLQSRRLESPPPT